MKYVQWKQSKRDGSYCEKVQGGIRQGRLVRNQTGELNTARYKRRQKEWRVKGKKKLIGKIFMWWHTD